MTASLQAALAPASIAIIGASENANKIGGRPLLYLDKYGFRGRIYPVNPSRREVQGRACYPDLDALPERPEMAVVAVPGAAAEAAVKDCAARGVKVAVVMSSGFSETDPVGGKAAERRMVEAARLTGMRIIGPNTQGVANFGTGTVASFSTMFLDTEHIDGPVAILSQSGAMSVVPYGLLHRRGIGVRQSHATGNDSDVSVAELTGVVAADPDVKLLLLYLEGMPDPHHLAEAAAVAGARDLPIVALKAGRTPAGQEAARSHTGALANEDRVVSAFFEHHGIFRVDDIEGLVRATELYLKGWRAPGRRLVSISNSGALCVLSADAAFRAGMSHAKLKPETRAEVAKILPSFATSTNPIDLTAALLSNNRLLGDILPVIARDPAADCFLIGVPVAGTGYDLPSFAEDAANLAEKTGKPVMISATQDAVAQPFVARGLPVFTTESEAISAMAQLVAHTELMARTKAAERSRFRAAPGNQARQAVTLNEAESLAIVAKAGIAVAKHELCRTAEECVAAWRKIDGPVVLKGCSRDAPHKSELGLVRLGLDTEQAIVEAFGTMTKIMRDQGLQDEGVIVAAMVKGRREMMIGAHRDPLFGPVVMVGDGGKYVEALGDVRVLLPPFTAEEVELALRRLRIAPLLDGVRGEPPLDVAAFSRAAVRIGALMLDDQHRIASLDLNPVMVGAAGEGYRVVDALVVQETAS